MSPEVPEFMAPDLPAEPPKLNPVTLTVGSTVFLDRPSRYRRGATNGVIPVKVTSKGRVWIEVREMNSTSIHRLRMDNQTDGGNTGFCTRFRTPDQQRFHEALNAALGYLRDQGVQVSWESPWSGEGGTLRLARVIWESQNPPEGEATRKPFRVHHLDGSVTEH